MTQTTETAIERAISTFEEWQREIAKLQVPEILRGEGAYALLGSAGALVVFDRARECRDCGRTVFVMVNRCRGRTVCMKCDDS